MTFTLQITDDTDLTETQIHSILSLINSTWPAENWDVEDFIDRFVQRIKNQSDQERESRKHRRYVIWDDDRAIANAATFSRTVFTEKRNITVMALAAVCVSQDRRGNGLGKQVVECAFKRVDNGEFAVSLYQTGIPDFYRVFGADTVENTFYNSRNLENPGANPWWEPFIMIYPSSFQWPEGKIDLNGRAY